MLMKFTATLKNKILGNRLAARCLRACCWVGLGSIGAQAIRMIRMLVLTYILAPEDMGMIILVWYVLGLLQELSDVGTKHALIQNPRGLQDDYLNSAWIMNLIRCLTLIIILYFSAPLIAWGIYGQEELIKLLRLCCLILAFDGISSIGLEALKKQINLGRVSLVNISGHGVGAIMAIIFALKTRDAQGVVFGEICGAATICIMGYMVHPFRPKIKLHSLAVRELIGFGIIAYLVSLIDALGARLDVLILAKISNMANVGIYGPSMQLILAPCALFSLMTISVGFPALSLLQRDIKSVQRGTAEIVKASQMLSVPVFTILALMAPDLVRILPEKFAGVGPAVRILCLTGFLIVFMRQLTPALYAIKKVHWFILRGLLQIIIILLLLTPFYRRWGIYGLCWTINITYLITVTMVLFITLKELHWSLRAFLTDTVMTYRAAFIGLTCGGAVFLALHLGGFQWSEHLWLRLMVISAGLAGYGYSYLGTLTKPGTTVA